MKKKILTGLLGVSLGVLGMLGKAKLDDNKLNQLRYPESPTCLLQRDGGEMYVVLSSDEETKTYEGIRILAIFQLPFKIPARQLNERPDLSVVDCATGKPIESK